MKLYCSVTSRGTPEGCRAFPAGSSLRFEFAVSDMELRCDEIYFYLGCDERVIISRAVQFENTPGGFCCAFSLETGEFCDTSGLYFFHFEFVSAGRRYYAYFEGGECFASDRFINESELLVYRREYSVPEWFTRGAVYQIFPDRFFRSGKVPKRADTPYNDDWENGVPEYPRRHGEAFPNNTHFGGDLYGIAEKLPYIASLGVKCIYLNPIFSAFSNHKYDTGDFLRVDPCFGGDEALSYLLGRAHEAGIAVVLDGVFNHVGDDSIYFDRYHRYGSGACDGTDSPYYEWFSFTHYPDEYDSWWGIKNLPKVRRCESYRDFICKTVIPKYMNMGVDGWRLDVADELEADFLDDICAAIKGCKADALIIGEVWENAVDKIAYGERKRYFRGRQLDSVTNYPYRNAVVDYMLYGDAEAFVSTVKSIWRSYPPETLVCALNFLGSHDTERITTLLSGVRDEGFSNDELASKALSPQAHAQAFARVKAAYTILCFLPGVPCIYYGDEIGMEGYHDPFNRRPFPPAGFDSPESGFFAHINRVRRGEELFSAEYLEAESVCPGVADIRRRGAGGEIRLVSNMSSAAAEVDIGHGYTDLLANVPAAKRLSLPPGEVYILKRKA